MKNKIHVIPQTHWDKEWYFTKEVSDIFLIDNIDKLYEIWKRDKNELKNFIYDGQFSVVDDYLSYFPENEYKIKELISNGILKIGPWYTQMDTINSTGESIVRNLIFGTKQTEKYGPAIKVGYIPDSFGFNPNLPQILSKAGLKALIQWRGITEEHIKNGLLMEWKGIDGSVIPTINLTEHGYSLGGGALKRITQSNYKRENLKQKAEDFLNDFKNRKLERVKFLSRNLGNNILLPLGGDQQPVVEFINYLIDEINEIDNENEWIVSDYDTFVDEVLKNYKDLDKNFVEGELRFGQFAKVHKTITSSRYDIKQKVKQLENLIYREIEPLSILFEKMGGKYPTTIIKKNIMKLLECQAHDSLGGCNTDETNESVLQRLNSAIFSLEGLSTNMKKRIVDFLELSENDLLVFNLYPENRDVKAEFEIHTRSNEFDILDENDRKVKFSILNQKHINKTEFIMFEDSHIKKFQKDTPENGQYWTKIFLEVKDIEKVSFKKLKVVPIHTPKSHILNLEKEDKFIENERYSLKLNDNGTLDIFDKKNNNLISEAIKLVSDFDAGDLYDFSPSLINEKITCELKKIKPLTFKSNGISTMVIDYKFNVPTFIDSHTLVNQDLKLVINLNENIINFDLEIENQVKDIRWRVIFETKINSKISYSDTSFGITERSVDLKRQKEMYNKTPGLTGFIDYPIEIESMESVVYLKNDTNNFNVYTLGTNEYQIIGSNYSQIALTLFRGVPNIGRRKLKYRAGTASGMDNFPLETPLGLLQKKLKFNFAIELDTLENPIKNQRFWSEKAVYYMKQGVHPYFWRGDSFNMTNFELKTSKPHLKEIENLMIPKEIILSAFYKSWDLKNYILRFFNAGSHQVDFKVPNNFELVNLMEESISDKYSGKVESNEVLTFKIKINGGE